MLDIKRIDEASQDFAADLVALREDITKLTASVTDLMRAQASATTNTVFSAVDTARQKISTTAADAQDRVTAVSADIEASIERNPMVAVLIAAGVGLLLGFLSRPHK